MTTYDPEIERLRVEVSCATLLERLPPPWLLDRAESTKNCLKYRREVGEVLIVNHAGRGWWDPQSEARGDVFDLVQHLDPSLNFGEVRKLLRPFIGLSPTFPEATRRRDRASCGPIPADRWAFRPPLRPASPGWRYLTQERRLPESVIKAATAADVLREGAYGSPWFAHRNEAGAVTHVEIRAATYRGSLAGGVKTLFRFPGGDPPGSASLSVLFSLIWCVAVDIPEYASENKLGSRAGRAGSGCRSGRRSLGDLGSWARDRLVPRMPKAIDTPAQPVFPTSSRPARARRRRDREAAGEPLAMSERRLRAPDICGSTAGNCFSSRASDPSDR